MFPNVASVLPLSSLVTQKQVHDMIQSKLPMDIGYTENVYVTTDRLWNVLAQVQNIVQKNISQQVVTINQSMNYGVLENMYQTLHTEYIDTTKLTGNTLLYGAAKWLANSLNDPYTTFMPPTQATDFNDEIQWQFEWIGAYVDIKKPWVIVITAPINWSPANRAGLLPGDQIIKVDDHEVIDSTELTQVVSWIKWLPWTSVTLTILRNNTQLTIPVTREKIVIKNIESKIYSWHLCYMKINLFDFGIHEDFNLVMDKTFSPSICSKYIFDVRNNPGWSLEEVVQMLNYIVPTKSPSVIIKWKTYNQTLVAEGDSWIKITDKNIIVLINKWSASASEIFAGVIKDYWTHVALIGENTFWKWSVQTITEYPDGSLFKYTIAKRYTGKSQKNIDKIWFFPDEHIYNNSKTTVDEQLDYALSYTVK